MIFGYGLDRTARRLSVGMYPVQEGSGAKRTSRPRAPWSGKSTSRRRPRWSLGSIEPLEVRCLLAAGDPNDQISEAIDLGALTQARTITGGAVDDSEDVDMYRFQVTAGDRVKFDIDRPAGSTLDSYIRLFDGNGTQLTFNDDGPNPDESSSTESYFDLSFNSGGTFFLGISGFGNSSYSAVTGDGDRSGSTGAYTIVITPVGNSANSDSDDQISEATPLGTLTQSQTISGQSISVSSDVDLYGFQVTSGQRVSFNINRPTGSTFDSFLRLFDSNGNELAFNDDGPTPGETSSVESYIDHTFTSGGTFFVGVSGFGNSSYNPVNGSGDGTGSTGAYTLVITPGGGASNSDSDDQFSEATSLGALSQTQSISGQSISIPTDVDMFGFQATAGQRVTFNINRPTGSSLDSYLRLFDSSGTQIAFNDDGPTPGEVNSVESFLDFTFTTAGTYFLGVSGYGNSAYDPITGSGDGTGSTGAYTLLVTPSGGNNDPDDQISEATPLGTLTQVQTISGQSIQPGTDVDLFGFQVAAGARVSFNINRPTGSTFDSFLRLFDSNGNELAFNDDGPTPGEANSVESYLDFTFVSGGTFFLGVSGFGNSAYNAVSGANDVSGSTGSYTLVITPTSTDSDPDDQLSQAIPLGAVTQSQSRNDSISVPTDVDIYSFQVTAGQRVSFNVDRPAGGTFDSFIRLFDASGSQLAFNDDGPTPGETNSVESYLEFTFPTAGTFFVGVSGYGNSSYLPITGDGDRNGSTGAYTLVVAPVTSSVADDSFEDNDTQSQAADLGTLTSTRTVSNLVMADSADWFKFTTSGVGTSSSFVRIAFTNSSGNLDLALVSSSGQDLGRSETASNTEQVSLMGLPAGTYFGPGPGVGAAFNPAHTLTVTPPGATQQTVPDDAFEENDTQATASDLGTLTSTRIVSSLVMADDHDWYRFTTTATGTPGDYVQIEFLNAQGNLELELFNAAGTRVEFASGLGDTERVSLDRLSAGTYFIHVFGVQAARNPNYSLTIQPPAPVIPPTLADDIMEENDTAAQAANLGTVTSLKTVTDLRMLDAADWFQFTISTPGTSSAFVRIAFDQTQGNLDLALWNSSGTQRLGLSANVGGGDAGNSQQLSLQGLAAGTYKIQVYGHNGARNPNYSLVISPAQAPTPTTGSHVLHINFDGATISRADLVRWAGTDWSGSINTLDPEGDGIRVSPFATTLSTADRATLIAGILQHLQDDLTPFGITVERTTGLAVENQFATTVFVGAAGSTLTGRGGIACNVDFGNRDRTDVAFAEDESGFPLPQAILLMSDLILHEAGHTYGLYHVNSGSATESMGLRYSAPQSQWTQDTSFINQTFPEFQTHGGGRGPENTFAVMRATFGGTGAPSTSNPFASASNPLTADQILQQLLDDEFYFPFRTETTVEVLLTLESEFDVGIASALAGSSAALLDDHQRAGAQAFTQVSSTQGIVIDSTRRIPLGIDFSGVRRLSSGGDLESRMKEVVRDQQEAPAEHEASVDVDAFFAPGAFESAMAAGFADA